MTARFLKELKELASHGQLKSFVKSSELTPSEVEYKGRRLVDFTNWDYLSLRNHKKITGTLHGAIEHSSVSVPSPRLTTGTRVEHLALEERLAKYLGCHSALLFSSRNQAAFTLFASLLSEVDTVFIEESAQAPVADAAYLVGASAVHFSLLDGWPKKFEDALQRIKPKGQLFIFADTLSPSTGMLSPVEELAAIAVKFKASLIFDDSYALGAIGLRGAGANDMASVYKQHLFAIIGCFGFGVPGFGGFMAGDKDLVGYLVNRSKTFLHEAPLPPYLASASEAAIDLIEMMTQQREMLHQKASALYALLNQCRFSTLPRAYGPVVCASFDKPSFADVFCEYLSVKGILAERVPRGIFLNEKSTVRFVVNASHTDAHIGALSAAIAEFKSRPN